MLRTWGLGIVFGSCLGLAHWPIPNPLFAVVGFMALYRLLDQGDPGRRITGPLYLGGALYFGLINAWYAYLFDDFGWWAPLMWILSASTLPALLVLFLASVVRTRERLGVPIWLGLPVFWTGAEAFQSLVGFPFGKAAYALSDWPLVLQFADLGGVYSVPLVLLIALGLLDASLFGRGSLAMRGGAAAAFAAVALAVVAYGTSRMATIPGSISGWQLQVVGTHHPTSNSPAWTTFIPWLKQTTADFDLRDPTISRLVVFPESALPSQIGTHMPVIDMVKRIFGPDAGDWRALTGASVFEQIDVGRYAKFNSVLLFGPDGQIVDRYDKRRLVPVVESAGLLGWIPGIERLEQVPGGLTRGRRAGLLEVAGRKFGVVICWEIVYQDLASQLRRDGAEFLVNPSDDRMFAGTTAPHIHAEVVRAIETRSSVVRPANLGPTVVVDATGRRRILAEDEGILEASPSVWPVPFAARHEPILSAGALALGVLGLGVAWGPSLLALLRRPA